MNLTITLLDIVAVIESRFVKSMNDGILCKNKQYKEMIDFVEGRYVGHQLGTNYFDIVVDYDIKKSK